MVFWLFVIGFNLTFLIQHVLGIIGMPRRVFTYPDLPWYGVLNFISTVGAFVMGACMFLLLYLVVKSKKHGKDAGGDPWNAFTPEWATTAPPPLKNFEELPIVETIRSLWDMKDKKGKNE